MTTAYELDQKLQALKEADQRRRRRFGNQPQSAAKHEQTAKNQRGTATTQHETATIDLQSIRTLRQALENPDLPASGRRVMEAALRRKVRMAEGKPATVGGETTAGREAR